jgi:diguanylate cyclase (GGDEF)-like protein
MWRQRSPEAASAASVQVAQDILRSTELATRAMVAYLSSGTIETEDQARALAATGKAPLRDTIALAELTKLYLYWREITIATLREEAARRQVEVRDIDHAVAVVRSASDRSVVRMTKQFDTERTRLQGELSVEQARLAHHAYHDALTGLPNRRLFFDRLAHALALGRRRELGLGLLFIDIDRFKAINDRLGHLVGDEVLVSTARRLVSCARESDTVARLGGDEFVILCELLSDATDQLVALSQRICVELSEPIGAADRHLQITVSIGITTTAGADDADTLIRQADHAMYIAKRQGLGSYHLWHAA